MVLCRGVYPSLALHTYTLYTYTLYTGGVIFDGTVYYEKDIATNTLKVVSTNAGEVSMRLVADRYDAAAWRNLRPDKDDDFVHHILEGK